LYIITGASSRNGAMAGITPADQITGDPKPATILNGFSRSRILVLQCSPETETTVRITSAVAN
jgi:hypothetical protein